MREENIDNWAKVAIICETSGTLRELFREAGHETISCDVLPADDLSPNDRHHFQGDAVEFLEGFEDGHFDLIVGHPPCQQLSDMLETQLLSELSEEGETRLFTLIKAVEELNILFNIMWHDVLERKVEQ